MSFLIPCLGMITEGLTFYSSLSAVARRFAMGPVAGKKIRSEKAEPASRSLLVVFADIKSDWRRWL
jgi:hypothetical protein